MLDKIELFKTRIFYENKTYLLVTDATKALGYESVETFIEKYSELIVSIEQMPKLISETDFNWLLSHDAVSLEKLKHLEITKIDTLRLKTETHKSLEIVWNEKEVLISQEPEKESSGEDEGVAKEQNNGLKKVYLTFDDGPSIYTKDILDILKRYNIKATFFVTGMNTPLYDEYLQKILERY